MKTIKRSDDTQYGSATNGHHIGSGFDVEIKRESRRVALVRITYLPTREDWFTEIEVEPDEDLQAKACHIGQCPNAELGGLPDDETSDSYVDRWNDITFH